ncbi:CDP-alcohol phosphatidyltransferase family protein [Jannaschia sp. CCS1]|uniref:CDP-alcohol phosphatidyltransferase family protein n=1 Tax=Jannaschia sp. (strain CCS1) TaxID=290400 RepID=UPI0020C805D2|nr:CDP-alcohol phosphatidyltransferase family protein [Jannaschia sp. CCS1]
MSDKPSDTDDGLASTSLSVAVQFVGAGCVGAAAVATLAWALVGNALAIGIAVIFFAAVMAIALVGLVASFPHRVIGLCNLATIARLALVSVLIAALVAPAASAWAVFGLAVLAFALDGLDGYLARREGRASAFGARFDMEVDSLLALTLALLTWQSGAVGAYVLILGLPRYAFWVAQVPFPWLGHDLPERFSRKVACVVQIAALILALFPPAPSILVGSIAGLAAIALVWSFSLDARTLWRAQT